MSHTVRRFVWSDWRHCILPAFEKGRDTASLDPIRSLLKPEDLASDDLDVDAHILRGRRYLLFGRDERKLIGVGHLLSRVLRARGTATLPVGERAAVLSQTVLASGECPDSAHRFTEQLQPDHGLPPWMVGDRGPSIVSADAAATVRKDLEAFAQVSLVQDHADLELVVDELRAFFDAEPDSGFAWFTTESGR